jgi:hypothetical protein
VVDVGGLYLNRPLESPEVLCLDAKLQIQALDLATPILLMSCTWPHVDTHDYFRHDACSRALDMGPER